MPSCTNTEEDISSELEILIIFHLLIRSSLTTRFEIFDVKGTVLEVPALRLDQHLIIFGRVDSRPNQITDNESENQASPKFGHCELTLNDEKDGL